MSARLYYDDAYTTQFSAKIIERIEDNGRFAIILNHSYFYPTSGGQPHDSGKINNSRILDVTIRESDDAMLHWIDTFPDGAEVQCSIDAARRQDHRQHHSGQHILSQAFIQIAEAETVGFHLGSEGVTIDLNIVKLSDAQVEAAEQLANNIVWENRPITTRFVSLAEAQTLSLRKIPTKAGDRLRLVDITKFDLTACGGTHVAQTGEVGLIKIVRLERQKKQLRVHFLCGERARADYATKNGVLQQLGTQLTTSMSEFEGAIAKLQDELKATKRQLKQQTAVLLTFEAQGMLQQAAQIGETRVITAVLQQRNPGDLRQLGNLILNGDGVAKTAVLLALRGADKIHLFFACTPNLEQDMAALLKEALADLGSKSGGGRPNMAQGTAPITSAEKIETMLAGKTAVFQ